MKKFEYKVLSFRKSAFAYVEKYAEQVAMELNSLGVEGWELIETSGNVALEGFVILFLKRELIQQ